MVVGQGYADDLAAVYGSRKPDELVVRMQEVLDELVEWGDSCNLHFNPEKTVAVGFTRARTHSFSDALTIHGQPVQYVDVVKYLGLYLDSKLNWSVHLDNKLKSTKKFLHKMALIAKTTWGPKPHLMRWTWNCVVRLNFIYGSIIWQHSIKTDAKEKKVRRLNRLAMNTFATVHSSTPTQAMELITDTFPLKLYLMKEATCAFVRLQNTLTLTWHGINQTGSQRSHLKSLQHLVRDLGVHELMLRRDDCDAVNPADIMIRYETFTDQTRYLDFITFSNGSLLVFTKLSKLDGRVGCAFCIRNSAGVVHDSSFRISDSCSVFQAELLAIQFAAKWILDANLQGSVTFFVDSKAAMQALRTGRIRSQIVLNTITSVSSLTRAQFVWVKSHSGILDNDAVDDLAKQATRSTAVREFPIPKQEIKSVVLEALRASWDEEWSTFNKARMTKIWYSNQDQYRAKQVCGLSRLRLGRFIRIITGHNKLNYFQSVLNHTHSPFCRFCHSDHENFHHLATECPMTTAAQQEFFGGKDILSNMSWTVDELLDFSYSPQINSLLDPNNVHDIHLTDSDSDSD